MKKYLFPLIAIVLFTSCENKDSESKENKGMDHTAMADRNAEATNQVYRAIETGNLAGLDTLLTEDVIDHDAGPRGEDIKGRDSVLANLGRMHNYFDGLKFEMQHHATSTDGKYHYATVRMKGKVKENPWGMPAGSEMDDMGVDIIKIEDGKCAEHWGFISMHDFNEVMAGIQKASQPAPLGN